MTLSMMQESIAIAGVPEREVDGGFLAPAEQIDDLELRAEQLVDLVVQVALRSVDEPLTRGLRLGDYNMVQNAVNEGEKVCSSHFRQAVRQGTPYIDLLLEGKGALAAAAEYLRSDDEKFRCGIVDPDAIAQVQRNKYLDRKIAEITVSGFSLRP